MRRLTTIIALCAALGACATAPTVYGPATRAQGVGAKLAQRIILELRDKVSDEDISMPFSDEIGTISTVAETIHNTAKSEAISALVALGYGQTDAAAVIAPMEDSLAVDELIRRALKSFTRGK